MFCHNHPETEAYYRCHNCGHLLCDQCVNVKVKSYEEEAYCQRCGARAEIMPDPVRVPFWAVPLRVWAHPLRLSYMGPVLTLVIFITAAAFVLPPGIADHPLFGIVAAAVSVVAAFFALLAEISALAEPQREFSGMIRMAAHVVVRMVRSIAAAWPLSVPAILVLVLMPPSLGRLETLAIRVDPMVAAAYFGVAFVLLFLFAAMLMLAVSSRSWKTLLNPLSLFSLTRLGSGEHMLLTSLLVLLFAMAGTLHILIHSPALGAMGVMPPVILAAEILGIAYLLGVAASYVGWRTFELRMALYPYRPDAATRERIEQKASKGWVRNTETVDIGIEAEEAGGAAMISPEELGKLEEQLRLAPEDVRVLRQLLSGYEAANRIEAAEPLAGKLIALHIRNQNVEEGAKIYEEMYSYNRKFNLPPVLMRQVGEFYERETRWNAACLVWRNLAVFHSDSPLAPYALLRCGKLLSEQLNRRDAATTALRKVIRDFPSDPSAREAEALLADVMKHTHGMS